MRVFLDSSVLFSAIFSTTGHARDLLYHAAEDVIKIVLSQDVLDETERNLQKKSPNKLPLLQHSSPSFNQKLWMTLLHKK